MKLQYFLIQLFFLGTFMSCKESRLTQGSKYVFCTLSDAKREIVSDTFTHFFEKVNPLDIAIQIKDTSVFSQGKAVEVYKQFLKNDVRTFTKAEEEKVGALFDRALQTFYAIDSTLKLPVIKLIKVESKGYGSSAYYTRNACIVFPEVALSFEEGPQKERLFETMLHEIAHIYARYNNKVQEACYARLGFAKLSKVRFSSFLEERILLNPDGVDIRYSISLQDSTGKDIEAIPLIFSKFKQFNVAQPAFFSHLMFQFFEVEINEKGEAIILAENLGYDRTAVKGFWEQVTRNTDYIIHPDELLADNLVFLALYKAGDKSVLENLEADGQKLLLDLEQIILK